MRTDAGTDLPPQVQHSRTIIVTGPVTTWI
jgi:hypothetical protein